MKVTRIGVINIGDELLLGQVIDSNSARIGQFLAPLGLSVHRKWCVWGMMRMK
jgi:molybdopterin-biosynthesis enzyme MoeA-like protein